MIVTEVQELIAGLRKRGWAVWAIAEELDVTYQAVSYWERGQRQPSNSKGVVMVLKSLAERKQIPRKRRPAKHRRRVKDAAAEPAE